jgi:UTP--glucose-1-phosphate uridylyltransferase
LQMVVGYEFDGERHDVGDKFGFVKATVDFALEREDLREQVLKYLLGVIKKEEVSQ